MRVGAVRGRMGTGRWNSCAEKPLTRNGQVGMTRGTGKQGATAEAVPSTTDSIPELEKDLADLRQLVEQDAVEEARARIQELQRRWPDSKRIRHWARVLAPPEVLTSEPRQDRPLLRERAWLKAHAHEHPGCWLAVYEDRLVAADPDLGKVLAATRHAIGSQSALLHFQPPPLDADAIDASVSR